MLPDSSFRMAQHEPALVALTDEDRFLRVVGSTFLEVGQLVDVWDQRPHGFRDEHPKDVRRRPYVLPVSLRWPQTGFPSR